MLPLAIPGIAAGSILPSHSRWAILLSRSWLALQVFYRQYGLFPAGGDWQYADGAAFTLVPIVLIALYLAFVKRWERSMHSERAPFFLKLAAWAAWFSYIFPF